MLAWGAAWTCWKPLILRGGQPDARAGGLGDASGGSETEERPGDARFGSDSVPAPGEAWYGEDESRFASVPPGSAMIRGGDEGSWAAGAAIWPVTGRGAGEERVLCVF